MEQDSQEKNELEGNRERSRGNELQFMLIFSATFISVNYLFPLSCVLSVVFSAYFLHMQHRKIIDPWRQIFRFI